MKSNAAVVVKKSSIDRNGVFAAKSFRRGEVVVTWDDTREISQSESEALSLEEKNYLEIQNGKILLVGVPERFINHSCEANTLPGDRCDVAGRDIEIGEEITADYSSFYIPSGQFYCSCGSRNCRVLITGVR